ncbi:MAG TPA: hypothetical protein VI298_08540 [Geobacteraceae bacterium]
MEFKNDLGNQAIQDVITAYPGIGEILDRVDIGCVTCKVGICLLKDVVAIHGLSKEDEAKVEAEINDYLDKQCTVESKA